MAKLRLLSRPVPIRTADAVVAGLFMLLGSYVVIVSITELRAFTQGQVGPGVLPFLIGATLIMTSTFVLLGLRSGSTSATGALPSPAELSRPAMLLAAMIVAIIAMPVVGSLVTLGLLVLFETMVIEKRGWRLSLVTACTIPVLLYLFFELMLGVPLPSGTIGLI